MDHHLDDTLNLESAIGVDFDHASDIVVNQADIALDSSSNVEIPMEFENIEEQPLLMDTGNEEIIELMGDQFTIGGDNEFSIHDDPMTTANIVETPQSHSILKDGSIMNLQFEPQTLLASEAQVTVSSQPAVIKLQKPNPAKTSIRQVAIAPKPRAGTPKVSYTMGKQCAIAPRPVALVMNKTAVNVGKKVPLSSVLQSSGKPGTSVLAQIGKQLVMMPAASQKIKMVPNTVQYLRTTPAVSDQAQITKNQKVTQNPKKILTKVIVQGQQQQVSEVGPNQPAVITKILPTTATPQPTRFVTVHPQSLQYPVKNKLLVGSPTTSFKLTTPNNQLVTVKSPTASILPTSAVATKKILIPANQTQNVVLKAVTSKPTQIMKADGNIVTVSSAPRTRLHQIHVPGKGMQYIKLVTNSSTTSTKNMVIKPQSLLTGSQKTFVVTDNKGNIIDMTPEKIWAHTTQPLVLAGNNVVNKVLKPQQKLVRIAPVSRSGHTTRPSQSLLAPISAVQEQVPLKPPSPPSEEEDKEALRTLLHETVMGEPASNEEIITQEVQNTEVEIEYERMHSDNDDNSSSSEHEERPNNSDSHPLIVIPNYRRNEEDNARIEDYMDSEMLGPPYNSPKQSQCDNVELGMRPRKACNCTRSQCLKLYCDCFANGEFCNQCNCNNCHNNLDNEELRQKAIRGCLERNPNAFRPKIGKAKGVAGPATTIRRHNKGCHCKRSGCLKNYCECYEAKIACSGICKCVGCRNVEESLERRRLHAAVPQPRALTRPPPATLKQPCSLMTSEVIEAACQCLLAAAVPEGGEAGGEVGGEAGGGEPVRSVLEEFARCLQEIIGTSHHADHLTV